MHPNCRYCSTRQPHWSRHPAHAHLARRRPNHSKLHPEVTKKRPGSTLPASENRFDLAALIVTGIALAAWVSAPDAAPTSWAALVAGLAIVARLSRWRGLSTVREPLLPDPAAGHGADDWRRIAYAQPHAQRVGAAGYPGWRSSASDHPRPECAVAHCRRDIVRSERQDKLVRLPMSTQSPCSPRSQPSSRWTDL